jgi:uncharacterized membrane protein
MIRFLIAFLAIALGSHAMSVWYLPRLAMNTAMARMEAIGAQANTIAHIPPTDETSRRVVRPSPDLLYSICLLDLADGPVRIRAADWGGYLSLSLFAANTDNVFARNDGDVDGDIDVTVANSGDVDVLLGSTRGIAIIRRLATDPVALARADEIRRNNDMCEPL